MTKKMKKMKKDAKRKLASIGYKKAARDLKNKFLQEFKTAIYDSSYINENNLNGSFHPNWGVNHPTITEYCNCWGKSEKLAKLDINKLTKQILTISQNVTVNYIIVECYHPKSGYSWVTF